MDDPITMLERAMAATGTVVKGVRPSQYDAPTPCPQWDVRGLINHIVAGNRYFAVSARNERPDMSVWGIDHIGDADPGAVYDETAQVAMEAWRAPEATERTAKLPSGGQGPKLFHIHLMDLTQHGWDLATATGQDRSLDREVVQAVYHAWHGRVPPEIRGEGGVFGPEVACSPDAPTGDRLAAYLGRTP